MEGELWVVLGCSALTLFFSVAHYALRNPSRVRLEKAFSGRRRAERLDEIERNADVLLLTTGIVRNVAHLFVLLAMLRWLGGLSNWDRDLIAVAASGAIIAFFGVGIPHAWAKYAGERTLAIAWPVLMGSMYVFLPATKALGWLDVLVRRLSGHREEANGHTSEVEQEILQLAEEGHAEGSVDPDERDMIESVIEFGDTQASEIMTPRTEIVALEVGSTFQQCRQMIVAAGHSRIPVYEETLDRVGGVLYAKDLLNISNGQAESFDLQTVMRKAFFVPETKPLTDLLRDIKATKVHMAIVLDEYGGTAGLVTIEDLLEQIVGDIADEYEPPEPEILHRVSERVVELDARMHIDDLNDELDIELPEDEDYDTVGGFVFSTLGYIPKSGDSFDYHGIEFSILDAEERKINRLRIRLPEHAGEWAERE